MKAHGKEPLRLILLSVAWLTAGTAAERDALAARLVAETPWLAWRRGARR